VVKARPHVLGIDDGPFLKGQSEPTPLVAVTMEGSDLVEAVAISAFPVDGDGITDFLASWISDLRTHPALQAIVLGGITIAGLAVVDARELARRLGTPVLVVTRRDPARSRVCEALHAAGLPERVVLADATPPARKLEDGLYLAYAGSTSAAAERIVRATLGKARLPEPLRLAHLIARALVDGESKGRA
jgi:endonuclease V-like protein UPF0215 family